MSYPKVRRRKSTSFTQEWKVEAKGLTWHAQQQLPARKSHPELKRWKLKWPTCTCSGAPKSGLQPPLGLDPTRATTRLTENDHRLVDPGGTASLRVPRRNSITEGPIELLGGYLRRVSTCAPTCCFWLLRKQPPSITVANSLAVLLTAPPFPQPETSCWHHPDIEETVALTTRSSTSSGRPSRSCIPA